MVRTAATQGFPHLENQPPMPQLAAVAGCKGSTPALAQKPGPGAQLDRLLQQVEQVSPARLDGSPTQPPSEVHASSLTMHFRPMQAADPAGTARSRPCTPTPAAAATHLGVDLAGGRAASQQVPTPQLRWAERLRPASACSGDTQLSSSPARTAAVPSLPPAPPEGSAEQPAQSSAEAVELSTAALSSELAHQVCY
jgi:hypothetical protein